MKKKKYVWLIYDVVIAQSGMECDDKLLRMVFFSKKKAVQGLKNLYEYEMKNVYSWFQHAEYMIRTPDWFYCWSGDFSKPEFFYKAWIQKTSIDDEFLEEEPSETREEYEEEPIQLVELRAKDFVKQKKIQFDKTSIDCGGEPLIDYDERWRFECRKKRLEIAEQLLNRKD